MYRMTSGSVASAVRPSENTPKWDSSVSCGVATSRGRSGAREKELQHAKLRLFHVPGGTTFDIYARSLLVGRIPGVVRVEVGHRRRHVRCVGAEIFLIDDVVLVHDERHHAGVA